MKSTGLLALFVILFASFASSQFVEDFAISSEPVLQTYQGTPADSHFKITNTGSVASGYTVSVVASEAASWARMGPLSFTLEPGQTKIVLIHLDVPQDTETGTYGLTTVFSTVLGTTITVDQDVRVDVPMNVELQSVAIKPIRPCGTATYPVTVLNTGAFPEEYDLTVSKNVAGIASFSQDNVVLGKGENKTVQLTLKPEDCSWSGEKAFTVKGFASSTEQTAELELTLPVENTFIPEITINDLRLNTDTNTFNATITNTGTTKATYAIEVSGADFVSVSPKSVTLAPETEATLTFTSAPSAETGQQKYPLTLTATVQSIEYASDFVLNLKNPTWIETHLWLVALIVIVALILIIIAIVAFKRWIAYTQTPEYQASQAEKARIASEVAAQKQAENAEKAKLAEKERLAKEKEKEEARKTKEAEREAIRKEKEQAKIDARIAKERALAAKEAQAELKASNVLIAREKLQGDAVVKQTKSRWWVLLVILVLVAGVLAYGFRTYLLANLAYAIFGAIVLAVTMILLVIHAMFAGRKKATQTWIALKPRRENQLETGWRQGIGQLWLRVKELVPNATVTVIGSRKNPSFVAPEGHVYQYITIMPEGLAEDRVEKQRFMFRVSRRWLEHRDISEGAVKLMRATEDGWKGIGTEKVRSDDKWVYYSAQCVGFEPFAIVGKSRKEEQTLDGMAPGWWYVMLGVVVILAILAGVWYFNYAGTQGTEVVGVAPTTTGIPPQAWDEDTRLTIDLAQHFTDPDGDKLTYTYTPIDNIIVTISGNMATLAPKKDWHGDATITFTANDGKGGKVSSNAVALFVRDVPEPTFWTNVLTALRLYSIYIVGGIVLLIVIIAVLEHRKKFIKG
ncbi:PGF-pre-PGF domain-containing protein [Candidatus Woesearchaeota archaeon]|nr:PGF-pre-PGF domain-containing protein [Candidatus Woesearchaeota archaeon]